VHEGRILPVKRTASSGQTSVLGPVLDQEALAASDEADRSDHEAGRHGDTCLAARSLTRAIALGTS
jgi:hypothetical protein